MGRGWEEGEGEEGGLVLGWRRWRGLEGRGDVAVVVLVVVVVGRVGEEVAGKGGEREEGRRSAWTC